MFIFRYMTTVPFVEDKPIGTISVDELKQQLIYKCIRSTPEEYNQPISSNELYHFVHDKVDTLNRMLIDLAEQRVSTHVKDVRYFCFPSVSGHHLSIAAYLTFYDANYSMFFTDSLEALEFLEDAFGLSTSTVTVDTNPFKTVSDGLDIND